MQANTPNQDQSSIPSTIADQNLTTDSTSIAATAPGQFRVIRRNGKVTAFDGEKISVAMTKAFLAVEGGNAAARCVAATRRSLDHTSSIVTSTRKPVR